MTTLNMNRRHATVPLPPFPRLADQPEDYRRLWFELTTPPSETELLIERIAVIVGEVTAEIDGTLERVR
jgi:hypothetical protein